MPRPRGSTTDVAAQARRQQRIEALCAASVRALAGEPDLHFRGGRLHRGGRPLPLFAPHLHPDPARDDFASFRGAADGLALRLARSDASLHRALAPDDAIERALFDLLEQYRVEALVPAGLSGVARNLRHRHEAWSLGYHDAGLADTDRGLLVYTVAQVCRARVTGEPVVEATEDLLEATRAGIAPLIGAALGALRRTRFDQAAYAIPALAIAHTVAALLRTRGGANPTTDTTPESDREAARSVFGLIVEPDGAGAERFASAVAGRSRPLDAAGDTYRVFTTDHDRELDAATLARRPMLDAQRARLDRLVAAQGVNGARLARDLHALLARPAADGFDGGRDEGVVDGRRLARLVASPSERNIFRAERTAPVADAALTFLVDCSGSMKAHVERLAVLLDVFARALDAAGVASEVLGFTTGAWNGGRAQRDWVRAGRPAKPGRLNEALHLVFKRFDTPWRRARRGLAALLQTEGFREGLDGEAVDWAAARLAARPERRRLLLVVSDGSPMDRATILANDALVLDRHLQAVVQRLEAQRTVEPIGIGVGLDPSPHYRRSHVLDLDASGGRAMFREVLEQIAARDRR